MSVFGRIELLNLAGEAFCVRVRDFLPLGLIGTISATLFLLDGLRKVQLESEPKGNITSLEPGLMQNWIAASFVELLPGQNLQEDGCNVWKKKTVAP